MTITPLHQDMALASIRYAKTLVPFQAAGNSMFLEECITGSPFGLVTLRAMLCSWLLLLDEVACSTVCRSSWPEEPATTRKGGHPDAAGAEPAMLKDTVTVPPSD